MTNARIAAVAIGVALLVVFAVRQRSGTFWTPAPTALAAQSQAPPPMCTPQQAALLPQVVFERPPPSPCGRQRRQQPVIATVPRPVPPRDASTLSWSAPSTPNVDLAAAEALVLAGKPLPAGLSARIKALSVAEVVRNPQFRPTADAKTWCAYTNPETVAFFPTMTRAFGPGKVAAVAFNPSFPGAEHLAVYDVMLEAAGAGTKCVAVDAGSNMGTIATYLASRGCRVFAYEAALWNYRIILSAVKGAGQLDRVTVLLGALSDSCGEQVSILEWDMNKQDGQHLAFVSSDWAQRTNTLDSHKKDFRTVYTRRIDDDVHEDVLILKTDVEGFDARCLAGATELLGCYDVPFVHSELAVSHSYNFSGFTGVQWLHHMAAIGYEVYIGDCQAVGDPLSDYKVNCPPSEAGVLQLALARDPEADKYRLYPDEFGPLMRACLRSSFVDPKAKVWFFNFLFLSRERLARYKAKHGKK
jgi:FkbM family methyltransferase